MSAQLSKREKFLAMIVGGAVLLIINVFLISFFFENFKISKRKEADKTMQLKALQALVVDTPLWEERDIWLKAHQPRLDTEERAGVELLNDSIAIAEKNGLVVNQKGIESVERKPDYIAITVTFQTKSSWKSLLGFMQQMQSPDRFVVFTAANLRIDSQDKTQMLGKFRISKWYAVK